MRVSHVGWFLGVLAVVLAGTLQAQREALGEEVQEPREEVLAEELWVVAKEEQTLAQLVSWCSRLYELDVQFDPSKLQDAVRLRVTRMMSGREVWELTNLALAERGLISVQAPGHEFLTITTIAEAREIARVEEPELKDSWAGYLRVLVPLEHVQAQEVRETLTLLVSKTHGFVSTASESAVLIGDLRPGVVQVLDVLALLDRPDENVVVSEVELKHATGVDLVALCERLSVTRNEVGARKLDGKVLAVPGSRQVLIVAPESELALFRGWVARFDRAGSAEARNYSPRRFGLAETAALVDQVLQAATESNPSASWNLVEDKLTGTLIVTAPPHLHTRVEDLFRRFEETKEAARNPIRTFPIKNRAAGELLGLLQELVDSGALSSLPSDLGSSASGDTQGIEGPTAPISTGVSLGGGDESGPEVTITADAGSNRLIAMGEGRVLDQLEALIETLDVPHPQVLVEALVVSLSEGDTLDLGVELQRLITDGDEQTRLSSLFGIGPVDPSAVSLPAAGGTGGSAVVLDPGSFSAVVSALQTLNEGRTLTIPKILVSNNQEASLDSVLQTPYTSTNASTTVATTSFGGTEDAGTSIQVTPTIAEGDRLVLDYTVAISSFVGDSADASIPPPKQENKLHSVVSVPDGFVVVVGGLEIETESEAFTQVPILGSIPILGALFRNQSKTISKSRFFVFLRCNVLRKRGFEDLKYLSKPAMSAASIEDEWPTLEPRVIR